MRLAFLLLLLGACGGAEPLTAGSAPQAVTVRTLRVTTSTEAPTVTATGQVLADQVVVLRAESAGVVEAVHFEDGEAVRAGQLLVSLRSADAAAGLAEAEAARAIAATDLTRIEGLAAREHAATATLDRARADLALAEARRDRAAEALRRTRVTAPTEGRVGVREVVPGDTVDPSRALVTLTDDRPLRVEVRVGERSGAWLAPGLPARVDVAAAGATALEAVVDFVDPQVDLASRTLRVRARLTEPPPGVRPGMTASVTLTLGPPNPVVRVPAEAVLTRPEGAALWTLVEGKAHLLPVVVGERLAADVVITEGLADGTEIVVQGIARLREGLDVRVLDAPTGSP